MLKLILRVLNILRKRLLFYKDEDQRIHNQLKYEYVNQISLYEYNQMKWALSDLLHEANAIAQKPFAITA